MLKMKAIQDEDFEAAKEYKIRIEKLKLIINSIEELGTNKIN